MKPYAYFLIGLSFFWASITLTNLQEQMVAPLTLCFFMHVLFSSRPSIVYFAALLYCIEYNLWHGTCTPPLIAMAIISFVGYSLKKIVQVPALVVRIALIGLYLRLEQYAALLLNNSSVAGYEQFFKTFLLSSGVLVVLAIFIPEMPGGKKK